MSPEVFSSSELRLGNHQPLRRTCDCVSAITTILTRTFKIYDSNSNKLGGKFLSVGFEQQVKNRIGSVRLSLFTSQCRKLLSSEQQGQYLGEAACEGNLDRFWQASFRYVVLQEIWPWSSSLLLMTRRRTRIR
uniref:Uncharacterized protein n=1 Tax=Ditylenchus dipsaci TaxID=166011 RepID=A0A915D694_9BILA